MSVPPPSPADTEDGPKRAWNGVIAIAGAVAGLTVLVYLVGAVTMWARFKATRLPPDLAVDHQSQAAVIGLGLRGVMTIAAFIVLLLFIAWIVIIFVSYAVTWIRTEPSRGSESEDPPRGSEQRGPRDDRFRARVLQTDVLEASAPKVGNFRLGTLRLLALVGATAIFISMFWSWHALAIALSVVAAVGAMLRYLHKRSEHELSKRKRPWLARLGRSKQPPRPSLALIVITLLAVGAAGVAWQLQPPVKVQTVLVFPLPEAKGLPDAFLKTTEGVPLPYLGETGSHVFVAEIKPQEVTKSNKYPWTYTGRIIEIPRDEVRLIFEDEKGTLYEEVKSPACALSRVVGQEWC